MLLTTILLEIDEQFDYFAPSYNQFLESKKEKVHSAFKRLSPKALGILTAIVMLVAGTAFASGGIQKAADWWNGMSVAEGDNLDDVKQFGVGNRLGLEVESNGIKVTITHVVADDIQTFIYYEVEDLEEDRILRVDHSHPPEIAAENGVFSGTAGHGDEINSIINIPNREDNTYRGRIGMRPINEKEAEMDLQITKLVEVTEADRNIEGVTQPRHSEHARGVNGEWTFTIPVKKDEIIEKNMNLETELAGHPIQINKLTIAPTITMLDYQFNVEKGRKSFLFEKLEGKETSYKREIRTLFPDRKTRDKENKIVAQAPFESMYYATPDAVDIVVNRLIEDIPVNKEFSIDPEIDVPQVFECMGSELSVENIELGSQTSFIFKNAWSYGREYERLNYEILSEPESRRTGFRKESGIYIDKNGDKYEQEDLNITINSPKSLRYFPTEREIILGSDSGETIKPTGIKIHSYQVTTFPDEKIELEF